MGIEPSVVAVTVRRINSLPAAVHLHTPPLASGPRDVPHIQGACTHPLVQAGGQWNSQHEHRVHGNVHLPPFLESPAGCAVQGPPNVKHHLTRKASPPHSPDQSGSCHLNPPTHPTPKPHGFPPLPTLPAHIIPILSSPSSPHQGWLHDVDAIYFKFPFIFVPTLNHYGSTVILFVFDKLQVAFISQPTCVTR